MKKYFLIIFILGLCGFSGSSVYAVQQNEKVLVRGKIISTSDGLPLPMAHVFEVNKDKRIVSSAVSDLDGNYSLLVVSTNNSLEVKYMGFKTKIVPIKGKTVLNIGLDEENIQLHEAVVTAKRKVQTGMMNIDERDVTSSVVRLDTKEIEELSSASIDDAIQGRMAGVDIVASSGDPGAGMSIRIRGTTSINGNQDPLIVVDGVILDTDVGDFDFANATEQEYSQLLNIATSDIANIAVLKDAAATAIYGSKAANGVLQITTKRGKAGPPRVSLTSKTTLSHQPDAIPSLNGDEYTTLITEEFLNAGVQLNMLENPEFAYDINNPYYYYNYGQNTDWIDEITQTGKIFDNSVSISGGTSKVLYRFSAGYWDQQGGTVGTALSRLNTRMNIDYNVSEKIRFSADISYTHTDNDRSYDKHLRSKAYTKMPNQSVYEYTEGGIETDNYFNPLYNQQGIYPSTYNPVALAKDGMYKIKTEKIIPKLNLIWKMAPVFRYSLDISFDITNTVHSSFLPRTATGLEWTDVDVNRSFESDGENFTTQVYNRFLWMPNLGDLNTLNILVGTNTYTTNNDSYGLDATNSASSQLQDGSFASTVSGIGGIGPHSGTSEYRSVAVYGQVQYSLLDRYIMNATVRRDGSSKFGKSYRYGTFPSASARWRVSGEPFMRTFSKWLTEFSLRGSYGINGNEPKDSYLQYSKYATYGYTYLDQTGTYTSNLQLSNLKWERTTQWDLGANLILFDGRINADFDYYYKSSDDLLFKKLTIPSTSGYNNVSFMNVGKMDNMGWEFSLMTTPYKSKNWRVNFNLNISRSQNYIRELSEYISSEQGTWNANGSYMLRYIIDQPLGSFYGYQSDGVYLNQEQTIALDASGRQIYTYNDKNEYVPLYMSFGAGTSSEYQFKEGDAKYKDINHDGNINYLDVVYLGDSNPEFFGGFGPSVNWKGRWTLSAHFNFRYGNDVVNQTKINMENMRGDNNQSKAVLRRWRHSYADVSKAPSDLLPRALYGTGYNYLASDRFVEDGSFLRFRSLTLKYSFNPNKLKRYKLNSLSLWFTAQNLYVWTNYTGQDPEVSISDPLKPGYDEGYSPRQKDFIFGLSITL